MNRYSKPKSSKENALDNPDDPRFVIKKDGEYLIAECTDGSSYMWLDKLNCRSISHRYDLVKMTKALNMAYSKNILLVLPNTHFELDTFEKNVECIKQINKFRSFIPKSIKTSPHMFASNFISDSSVAQIFDRKQCAEIILTDYMKIYKRLVLEQACTIDLIDNQIYDWLIGIDCKKMMSMDESLRLPVAWGHVILELRLHSDLHPSYPPSVRVIAPEFKHDLASRISRSKFTKAEYWCCDRTPYDIVMRTIRLLKRYGEITHGIKTIDIKVGDKTKKLMETLEGALFNVGSMLGNDNDDEIDQDQKFVAIKTEKPHIVQKKTKREETGTGYGYNGASVWDQNEYDRVLKERTHRFILNVNSMIVIINKIMDLEKGDISCTVDMFKKSVMFKYFVSLFKNISILEITNNSKYYRAVFDMIQLYCLDTSISLFYDPDETKSMYRCIVDLDAKAQSCLELDDSNENANIIFNIHNMIEKPYKSYIGSMIKDYQGIQTTDQSKSVKDLDSDHNNQKNPYNHTMLKYKYKLGAGLSDDPSYYYRDYCMDDETGDMKSCYKRMSSEIPVLIECMSVDENALVLMYVDRKKPNCIRYLLNGPPNTPYARGLFIFDSYCGIKYPLTAPEFHFVNTSGFRFNPNLYSEGKVCLSLLGTYSGPKPHESERWNPKISTLAQVIFSIQSLIFTDQPYFNEPGYDKDRKTASGISASKAYNEGIRLSTMKASIIDTIMYADRYPQFKNAILTHFYLQKEKILEQCRQWVDECSDVDGNKTKMTQYFGEIQHLFQKLKKSHNE
jgi:ubiquitin-protein ligase